MTEKALSIIIQREDLPQLFGKRVENQAAIEEVISKIETESRSITFDINTKDGQATCRSLAAKIASAKSTLDKAGKAKKDEYTVTTKLIDADRNLAKSRLQALQDEIRQPLTELEEREKARKAQHEANLAALVDLTYLVGAHSSAISERINTLQDKVIDDDWEEYKAEALEAKDLTLKALRNEFEVVKQCEDEQAELARLRAEQARREQQEREERIAQEATAKAKADAERQAQQVAQEAERKEREAKEREARLIAEKEAAELRAKQQAEDAAKREREAIEAERLEAERLEAKRQANKKHRDAIFIQAKDDLMANGIDEEVAKQVVRLIHANKIANVTIKF
ncbi:hypothetical protein [Psychrobacter sanguinis]|uniref:hypothetical protein n=1 Tax=Psychrobacter sanguinis TaxID=861445 RepID=UPI002A75F714|nr:hypothetical protein [Psychrobacter sanguinis]MDY3306649.1 hypothetical protein [Psychrobacter sanguinis]